MIWSHGRSMDEMHRGTSVEEFVPLMVRYSLGNGNRG